MALVDLDRLSSGERSEKNTMGTRKTSETIQIGKATPVERHGLRRDGKATRLARSVKKML